MNNRTTTAQSLRPLADAAEGWREHLRTAFDRTGHTQASIASALGCVYQFVQRWVTRDENVQRNLTATHLEALRDNPCTRDAWLHFLQLHALAGGATVADARADGLVHATRLSRLMREAADVTCYYAEALATNDGGDPVDDLERAKLDRELGELGDAIAAARLGLRQQKAAG